jgi:predicted enzyme related to lactoylglutathione lyase
MADVDVRGAKGVESENIIDNDECGCARKITPGEAFTNFSDGQFRNPSSGDIKRIKFINIPVRDQKRALDFYTDRLGFTIITDQPFDDKQRWIELRIPKAETRVVLFTTPEDEKRIGTMMNMSYECDDIDATYEQLKKRGVEFEGPPQKQPWGTCAMFKDSEGNRFVLSAA